MNLFVCHSPSLASIVLFALAVPASGQIIVGHGGDLQAAIDSAPSGAVIELHSDGPFEIEDEYGPSVFDIWDKTITVRAGDGFRPVVRGGFRVETFHQVQPAIARFESLVIQGLKSAYIPTYWAEGIRVGGGDTGAGLDVSVEIVDCVVIGGINRHSALDDSPGLDIAIDIRDSAIVGAFLADIHEYQSIDVVVHRSVLSSLLRVGPNQYAGIGPLRATYVIHDTVIGSEVVGFGIGLDMGGGGERLVNLELRRCRVYGPIEMHGWGDTAVSGSRLTALIESSTVVATGPGQTGVNSSHTNVDAPVDFQVDLVNLTVTGFERGIRLSKWIAGRAENMLLFDNADDVAAPSPKIWNSFIASGEYDGLNGNFTGDPQVDAGLVLAAGSVGEDAGNSTAFGLGATDVDGLPRIQDSDGDGVPEVSVGARETSGLDLALTQVVNGAGVNKSGFALATPPRLGSTLIFQVPWSKNTDASATMIAIGSIAPSPFPFGPGELLLDPGSGYLLEIEPGDDPIHMVDVPDDGSLAGIELCVQGFRLDAHTSGWPPPVLVPLSALLIRLEVY